MADLWSISSFVKAWKLGCLRPDVEQSGTLQEQLRTEAAIVVIGSSSFYWRFTSFRVYTTT